MGGETTITIHNSSQNYNKGLFKTKVNQNIKITGNGVDTSVINGQVKNKGNNKTMELSSRKYDLMEYIAGLDGDKGTLTEEDFIKFNTKYKNDKDFRNQVNKKYNVTGVRQDAAAGVTTINFQGLDLEYNKVNSSLKVDFETIAERAKIER